MATAFGCVNNTIRLRSGHYFDLAEPKPDQFTLSDIAGALSKICRFGGQIDRFYSVAEHLINCDYQARQDGLPLDVRKAVFLHDATEAFCGDMVKPLKMMLPQYSAIEARIEAAIGERFGVDFEAHKDAVRKIDQEMLIAERRALFSADSVEWTGESEVRKLNINFRCLPPHDAHVEWFWTAKDLGLLRDA